MGKDKNTSINLKEISEKLQRDIDHILHNFIDHIPCEKHRAYKVDIDIDFILESSYESQMRKTLKEQYNDVNKHQSVYHYKRPNVAKNQLIKHGFFHRNLGRNKIAV